MWPRQSLGRRGVPTTATVCRGSPGVPRDAWPGTKNLVVFTTWYSSIGLGLLHTQKRKSVYFTQISYLK